MSDNSKLDRRIERTQTALWDAMFALMHEETWSEINVSMICKRANVARSSFYLHFQNKSELLDYGFEWGMRHARTQIFERKQQQNTYATFYWLTNHLYEGREFLNFKLAEDTYIFTRFQKMVYTLFSEELQRRQIEVSDYSLSFVMGGVFSILFEWVTADYPEPPEIMEATVNELTRRVI